MSVDAGKNVLTDSYDLLFSFPNERTSSLWGQLSPLRNAFQYVRHQPVVQVLIVSSAGKVQTVLLLQQEKCPPFLLQRYMYKRSWEHSRQSHKSMLVRAEFFFFIRLSFCIVMQNSASDCMLKSYMTILIQYPIRYYSCSMTCNPLYQS